MKVNVCFSAFHFADLFGGKVKKTMHFYAVRLENWHKNACFLVGCRRAMKMRCGDRAAQMVIIEMEGKRALCRVELCGDLARDRAVCSMLGLKLPLQMDCISES